MTKPFSPVLKSNTDNFLHLKQSKDTFKHILVLGGNLPEIEMLLKNEATVYATDGAANKLIRRGIKPDYIIGDMDSIDKSLIDNSSFDDSNLIRVEDQDTNDFEKALIFIMNQGVKYLGIWGFGGGELEHTLNNWSVLGKYSRQLNMCVINENRMGMLIQTSFTMNSTPGEKISIIPYGNVCISTSGLKWNLDEEYLILGSREGASNIAISDTVKVEIIKGKMMLFWESNFPYYLKGSRS